MTNLALRQATEESAIAEYSPTAAALAELRGRLANVAYDVSTTKGMDIAKRDRAEVRGLRTSLEKMRQDIKAPALERCRLIDAEAKRITAELEELETPIHQQIKAEEDRKEALKQAKIQAEFGRVQAIQEAIAEYSMTYMSTASRPSSAIAAAIAEMQAAEPSPAVFQEMLEQAKAAKQSALIKLDTALKAKLHEEAEAAKLAAERKELEELRAAQAEQKRKDAAAAEEARKAEAARFAVEMEAKRAEQKRLDEVAAAARAEEDRRAKEARAQAAAEHDAAMKAQADAATEIRRLAEEEAAKVLAKKRKAEAAEQKLRDAAPKLFKALQSIVRDGLTDKNTSAAKEALAEAA